VSVRSHGRSAALRTFKESNSPLDLFDWKFEKYLTPWIVRFTWLAVLALTSLWLTLVLISTVASFMPVEAPRRPSMDFEFRSPQDVIPGNAWLWSAIFRIVGVGTAVAFTILWLLWVRVLLESAIVIFNIAKTLASIDEKVPVPDNPG